MLEKLSVVFASALLTALIAGCSGAGGSDVPFTPSLSGESDTVGMSSSQQLWGFWDVALDQATGEFTVVSLRSGMFQANVTMFLQPPASAINLLSIQIDPGQSNLAEGHVVCDVTTRHPFPGLAQYRGFDVRGIVMGDGSITGEAGDGELRAGLDDMRLLNADGYCRWWNPTEFTTYKTIFGYTQGKLAPPQLATATVNAYKYFADGLEAQDALSELDLGNRGSFSPAQGANTRRYDLQFPVSGGSPVFKFNYAITASYLDPETDEDPSYPIESFSWLANAPEAFRIAIADAGSTAYYVGPSELGGNIKVEIEVFDWGFATTSIVTDEIAAITLESPTLFPGQVAVDLGGAAPGSTAYSFVFPVTIQDVTPAGVENQEILVRVLSTEPNIYAPDIPGITGFAYPDAPLTAYCLWEADVSDTSPALNPPEVGVIDGPDSVLEGDSALYTLSYATDPEDGTDLTILWDNDGDLDFADDTDGDDTNLEGLLDFPTKGNVEVIARAVDSSSLHTDSDPYDVVVTYCPTAVHDTFSSIYYSGVPATYWRMDSAFQTVGSYAGQLIVQVDGSSLGRCTTSSTGPWSVQPYITIQNGGGSTIIYSIDVDDYSGRVIVAGRMAAAAAGTFYVYDSGGTYLTSINVGSGRWIGGIDTDENGDVWVSTSTPSPNPCQTYLQHFVYQDSSPYYVVDPADELETTAQINLRNNTWDIAVSYPLRRIYLFHGNYNNGPAPYGELFTYDIADDGALTYNDSVKNLQVFATLVNGAMMDFTNCCTYGNIDIDHVEEASDGCRVVVMAKSQTSTQTFVRLLDANLNPVDSSTIPFLGSSPYSFSLGVDSNPANRRMVATIYAYGWAYDSEAPAGW